MILTPLNPAEGRCAVIGGRPLKLLCAVVCALLFWCVPSIAASPAEGWIAWRDARGADAAVSLQGAYVGVHRGMILVAGGIDISGSQPVYSDQVYALPLHGDASQTWQKVGALPRAMAHGAMVTTPAGLLCLGGEDERGDMADVVLVRWNAERGVAEMQTRWPALPRPVSRATASLLGGDVYLAGGRAGDQPLAQFLVLESHATTAIGWRALAAWPGAAMREPVLTAQGAAEANALFLFDAEASGEAFRYDPAGDRWRAIAPMPAALQGAVGVPVGVAHIILIGRGPESDSKNAWAYHTITNAWTPTPGTVPSAQPMGAINAGGAIVLVTQGEAGAQAAIGRVTSAASHFKALDYVTLTAYLVVIVLIGLYFSNRGKTTNDYFLAGNKIPWWAAGISLLATQVSSIGFMAVPAKSFATNWAYFLGVLTWFIVVPVVTRYYIPYFRKFNVASAYSYLEVRFNVATRLFAALAFSFMQIGRLAVVLLLPALALATITDLSLPVSIVLMGAIATLYTVTGGMAAVIWTDVVQAFLLMTGAAVAVVFVFLDLDQGLGQFVDVVGSDHKMRMVLPTMDVGAAAVWVVVVGNIFSRLSGLTSDQTVIQRYLTTPDVKSAKRALWLDVFTSVPWAVLVFLLGTALYVFYKTHPAMLHPGVDTNGVVPLFIAQAFPPGLTGLLIAAIFAAAMSSLDSSLHSTSTVLVSDFYIRFVPNSSERARVMLAKGIVLVLGVFGTATAIYLANSGVKSIWDQFIGIVGLFVGVLAGLFLLGMFTKRTDGWDALIGAVVGAAATFYVSRYTRVSFFLYPAVGIVACVAVAYLFSFIPRRRQLEPNLTAFTVSP